MKKTNKEILDLFKSRYTCKKYYPEQKVSDEDFKTIIEAGRLSPSSFGYEPWKFIRLKDKKIIEKIYPHSWGAHAVLDGASHVVLILARVKEDMQAGSEYLNHILNDVQNYPKEKIAGRNKRYDNFLEEDFNIKASDRAYFDWTSKQAYIALESMLLTAAALGVDSTPIEGFHQEKVHQILVEENVYDPKHFKIAVMAGFGYGENAKREKTRQSLEEVYKEV